MGSRNEPPPGRTFLESDRRRNRAWSTWDKVDSVLGIGTKSETEIPAEILALAEARTAAKKAKDFKRADAIRDELKAKGWVIEDTPKGLKLKKI